VRPRDVELGAVQSLLLFRRWTTRLRVIGNSPSGRCMAQHVVPSEEVPRFWRAVLGFIEIGKAAVAGAGTALALLGFFVFAWLLASGAMPRFVDESVSLNLLAAIGAAIGASLRAISLVRR
jgi:hypothetical protein